MILPSVQGNLPQATMTVFAACDCDYFEEFGPSLINSILRNTQHNVHIHLYNPTPKQITYFNQPRLSLTYETIGLDTFLPAQQRFNTGDAVVQDQLRRTKNAMEKGGDNSLLQRMQRTYYACARFIRLADIISPNTKIFAIDSDAIVRRDLPSLPSDKDFYIHHITGKRARFLAGGLYLNGGPLGFKFMKEYANLLRNKLNNDYIYWGLDQDVLGQVVPNYNFGQLPPEMIDWEMSESSYIWTAKGTRKNLEVFKNEKIKYAV